MTADGGVALSTFDLNCDMGESLGNWVMGSDEEIMPLITTANVACGFHGGDPVTMAQTVAPGASATAWRSARTPGYPDLLGFGRRRDGADGRGRRGVRDLPGRRAAGLPRRGGHARCTTSSRTARSSRSCATSSRGRCGREGRSPRSATSAALLAGARRRASRSATPSSPRASRSSRRSTLTSRYAPDGRLVDRAPQAGGRPGVRRRAGHASSSRDGTVSANGRLARISFAGRAQRVRARRRGQRGGGGPGRGRRRRGAPGASSRR